MKATAPETAVPPRHPFGQKRVGEILLERGWLEPGRLEEALREAKGLIGEWLVEQGDITDDQLAQALAEQFHLPYVNLEGRQVSLELFDHFPAAEAYRVLAVPLAKEGDSLKLALSNPLESHRLLDELERRSGLKVELHLSGKAAVQAVLERSHATSALLKDASGGFKVKKREEKDSVSAAALEGPEGGVVKFINAVLLAALQKRSSDIHFETYESGTVVKYRVDGLLYQATERLDLESNRAFVSRIKVMAELDIAETRIPQDGRFQMRLNGRDIDFRVSVIPGALGEDVVIRVLDRSALDQDFRQLNLDKLGLGGETLRKFRRAIREPYGMVLITGPTGSGKTTTLYGALGEINDGLEKIITIEDPVEYQLNGVVQVPVNEKKGLTFARGLRSILRHDPDKIMVGEIRDAETAQIAVQSALTGHLVFTTLHANNACEVMGRLGHMGIPPQGFVSALNCVMAQRLVRVICPHCRRREKAPSGLLAASGLDPRKYKDHGFYVGAGCASCGRTGYHGRVAVGEFLQLTPRIRRMILDQSPADELQEAAVKEGMTTLRQAALEKALAGETTLKEINRVTFVD
ncbi:MAG TPA: GspE/PulE family protein [bacterium]|nr:GspE/PulE family protein [bacterium]